ncbi:MAG TPA: VCBS repeat-containing protein [Thermoanaerobaculia bacterium]|nr:VCBS repeat-containing protein [Thermoanaerobaculia bacterium]
MRTAAITLALALFAPHVHASCAVSQFAAPPAYAHGMLLGVGDFNEDGDPDTVTQSPDGTSVHVNFGAAAGTFRAGRAIETVVPEKNGFPWPRLFSVLVGDWNGDGRQDLVTASLVTGAVTIHEGRGTGTFAPSRTIGNYADPRALAAGDFDGDGRLDLAIAAFEAHIVPIFWGEGDGTFALPTAIAVSGTPADVVAGDLDGDGRDDLIAGFTFGRLEVRRSLAQRAFAAPVELRMARDHFGLTLRDVNGDGRLDLAAADLSQFLVSIFPGNGDGTFGTRVDYRAGRLTEGIAFADLTGDGRTDIVAGNADGAIVVLAGLPDGTFDTAIRYQAGYNVSDVFVADVDADGRDDVLASDIHSYTVLVSRDDFQQLDVLDLGGITRDSALADFNSDGKPDLAVVQFTRGAADILLGGSDAPLIPHGATTLGPELISVEAADLNGDGHPDVVAGGRQMVIVAYGHGDGTFEPPQQFAMPNDVRYQVFVGDVDDDGDSDAVSTDVRGRVDFFINSGRAGVVRGNALAIGRNPNGALIVDVNADGRNDLLLAEDVNINERTTPGFLTVRLGNGDGTFGAPSEYAAGPEPHLISAADLDGDGWIDLALSDFAPNAEVRLFRGTGAGAFAAAGTLPGYVQLREVVLRDFNGDALPDVAFHNTGIVYVYHNRGGFRFEGPEAHASGDFPFSMHAADFDADGRLDLVTVGVSGDVSIHWNRTACRRRAARP